MTPIEQKADRLLSALKSKAQAMALLQDAYELELARVESSFHEIASLQGEISALDKGLLSLMKKNTKALFGDKDKVALQNGRLFFSKGRQVVLPRDVVARLERQGWNMAVKVAKAADREMLEKWDEERLAIIGLEKKEVKKYRYETSE